eukprot:2674287-Pleurochrysis_carterae.AAC.1
MPDKLSQGVCIGDGERARLEDELPQLLVCLEFVKHARERRSEREVGQDWDAAPFGHKGAR